MWNYRQLNLLVSPMTEILSRCTSKENLRLVVYHLSENHVECATTPNVDELNLGETCRDIKADSRHNHAVLAYDLCSREVYKIEDVPELPIASAVLLCVVTDLLNGCVQSRENRDGAPVAARNFEQPSRTVARDANGRFVKQTPRVEEKRTCELPKCTFNEPMGSDRILSGHRFRIGRR